MSLAVQFIRQPLVHFLLIGGAIFALFAVVSDTTPRQSAREIVVTEQRAIQLAERFRSVWQRSPTHAEFDALIDEFIKDEVLAREALALSLDRDDTVIRRRLRQKMDFLTQSAARALEPSDAELQTYLDANTEKYFLEPQIAFDQVFVGENRNAEEIARLRETLNNGADPASLGVNTLLPPSIRLSAQAVVERTFGRDFFRRLADAEEGTWFGPVESGYGHHFVRVSERRNGSHPTLENVREAVTRDWRSDRSKEIAEAQYARMLATYEVTRPDLSAIMALPE
ncbi:MAG: peptidylprolyl isomerase [Pseudomonadota bacterium]